MPPVIIGAAVAAGAYAAGITLVTAMAIGMAAAALYTVATMDIPSPGTSPQSAKQTLKTANQPYRGVFGNTIISGPLVFAEEQFQKSGYSESYQHCYSQGGSSHSSGSDDNAVCETRTRWVDTSDKWLHLVIVLAGHEVEEIPEVYFGDTLQTNYDHPFWKIHTFTGNQDSITDLPSSLRQVKSWKDNMIGKGIAFVHVQLRHSAEHFPNGIPNIKCKVKGEKVKTPFFNGFTSNAAAVIYHYLRWHFGATEKMINQASFTNEFNICNEPMTSEEVGGVVPIRYAVDGFYDYDQTHDNVLSKMLSACGGNLLFTNGQYYLQVAAYRGPVGSAQAISLSDLNGSIDINPDTPLTDRINTVKGTYVSPDNGYQVVDFPVVTNPDYVTEDGGEELVHDADFEYIINQKQAERIANIILKDNRFGLTIQVPMNLRGFKFNVGLPVRFEDPSLGYDTLEFRVATWKINPKSGITLTIKQTSPDIYDDAVSAVTPKPGDIDLPDPKFSYPINHLQFVPEPDDGVYDGVLLWAHPDLANNRDFDVILTSPGGDVTRLSTKETELRLINLSGVTYNVAVIANNRYGSPSVPVTASYSIGEPKAIASVQFIPDNFEVVIAPKVSGGLPLNTKFLFFSADDPENPDVNNIGYIGEGTTFTDVGLLPNKPYSYFIQVANNAAVTKLFGPYSTTTTDDPSDLVDLITPSLPGAYTWEVFATNAFGAGISRTYDPAVHTFKGVAYNKRVEEPSLNPLDYYFTRIGEFISDEDQKILDNLAQGKTPDGSDDLVGELAVKTIAAQEVTALKVTADWITANNIQSGAITADKIAVSVVSPINNYSETGSLRGWTGSSNASLVDEVNIKGQKARTLKVVSTASETLISSDKFQVDHNAIYEVHFSIYCEQATDINRQAFGVSGFDDSSAEVSLERYHPETFTLLGSENSPEFWGGYVKSGWRNMIAYLVGANASVESCPKSANVSAIVKLGANSRRCSVFTKVAATSGTKQTSHFYSPSTVKLGSGTVVANEIRANTLITSPRIEGGEMQSSNWAADPATNISPVGYKMYSPISGKVTMPDGTVLDNPDGLAVFQNLVANGHITAKSLTFVSDEAAEGAKNAIGVYPDQSSLQINGGGYDTNPNQGWGIHQNGYAEFLGGLSVKGATIVGATIVGADIYSGNILYHIDWNTDGSADDVRYKDHPDIPLSARSSYDASGKLISYSGKVATILYPVSSCLERRGEVNSNRFRWGKVRQGAMSASMGSASYVGYVQVRVSIVDPSGVVNVKSSWIKHSNPNSNKSLSSNITVGQITFKFKSTWSYGNVPNQGYISKLESASLSNNACAQFGSLSSEDNSGSIKVEILGSANHRFPLNISWAATIDNDNFPA